MKLILGELKIRYSISDQYKVLSPFWYYSFNFFSHFNNLKRIIYYHRVSQYII